MILISIFLWDIPNGKAKLWPLTIRNKTVGHLFGRGIRTPEKFPSTSFSAWKRGAASLFLLFPHPLSSVSSSLVALWNVSLRSISGLVRLNWSHTMEEGKSHFFQKHLRLGCPVLALICHAQMRCSCSAYCLSPDGKAKQRGKRSRARPQVDLQPTNLCSHSAQPSQE